MITEITVDITRKILGVVDVGLCSGLGQPRPGEMCVEAAVCYAMGLPHGDDPGCVNLSLRSFKISINDKKWSSNSARASGMRRLAIAQLGSTDMDSIAFCSRLSELVIRKIVPIALREIGTEEFNLLAVQCENEGTKAASAYAASVASAYAASVAAAASYAAAVASYAGDAAAYASAAVSASVSAAAKKRDEILTIATELAVQVLRELNQPGIALMDHLCPL